MPETSSEVLICISADSRAAVDDMVGKAQGAGGVVDPGPKQDYGFMYGRSFEDPDGHIWEVMWMDVAAASAAQTAGRLIETHATEYHRCQRFPPACGSTARPRRPRSSMFRCCRIRRIEKVQKNTVDGPAGKAGSVLVVEFTLAGQRFMALNGGMRVEYTHAVSFKIDCADQAEVDRLWDALLADGGQAERCGWIRDRYGVSWQIVPAALLQYLGGSDTAGAQRAMQAMLQMVKLDIAGLKQAYEGKSAA